MGNLSRRDFLRGAAVTAVGVAAASCAQPTAQIVEREVPVEKVVKETVVVEKEVAIEKVVTATAVTYKYKEAPMLAGKVAAGELPPADERVPEEPLVITPWEEIGQYGGTWHRLSTSQSDIRIPDRLSYEQVVRWDKDGVKLLPNVVKKWETNDDLSEYTFYLRKGMKWSDGAPYTADDISFYLVDHLLNEDLTPTVNNRLMRGGEPITFEKVDDYTWKAKFAASYPLFLVYHASANNYHFNQYPRHYCEQFHPAYADQAALDKAATEAGFEFWYQLYNNLTSGAAMNTNIDRPSIAPWIVTAPPPKSPVVHMRNPYYWKVDTEGNQLPYIDRVEHIIVQNATIINQRAIAGEVDMQLRHLTFDNYPLFIESQEQGDYRIITGFTKGYSSDSAFYLNPFIEDEVKSEIFWDKRFRYALSLGVNRAEIVESLYLGVTKPSQLTVPENSPFYWDEYANFMIEHDPDRANAYLDDMGLTERDADGYRLMKDGRRLSIVYEYAPVFGSWGAQGELLTAHWKDLGIELIVKEEARQLWNERRTNNQIEMTVWTSGGTFNPDIKRDWFNGMEGGFLYTYTDWHRSGGKVGIEPPAGSDHAKLFALDDQYDAALSDEERQKIFRQMLEIMKDNMFYFSSTSAPPEVVCVKNSFRNVPETAMSDWQLMTPGNTMIEQYFIRQ